MLSWRYLPTYFVTVVFIFLVDHSIVTAGLREGVMSDLGCVLVLVGGRGD